MADGQKDNDNDLAPVVKVYAKAGCNCQQCMRTRRELSDHSDDILQQLNQSTPAMLCLDLVRSGSTAFLPTDSEWQEFSRTRVECDALLYLNEKRIINWCDGISLLYPVKTAGDGNCLLHAVSLYMWAQPDYNITNLRSILHANMLTYCYKTGIRERWQKQREWQNSSIPDGGLHYTEEEWNKEWDLLVSSAGNQRQIHRQTVASAVALSFDFLEQIHVFVLANVLHRPIIILGEPFLRNQSGDSIAMNDFVGIYLPLIFSPANCHRSPIVLAFLFDHFLPLLGRRRSMFHKSLTINAVPLVTATLEPLRIHFLLPQEESGAHELLLRYMYLNEVETNAAGDPDTVLVARIDLDESSDSADLNMYYSSVYDCTVLQSSVHVKCITNGCDYTGWESFRGMCLPCWMKVYPMSTLEPKTPVLECAIVGCKNACWLPFGGLCRLCYIGLVPKHRYMTFIEFTSYSKYGTRPSRAGLPSQSQAESFQNRCTYLGCCMEAELEFDGRKCQPDKYLPPSDKDQLYWRIPELKKAPEDGAELVKPMCVDHAIQLTMDLLYETVCKNKLSQQSRIGQTDESGSQLQVSHMTTNMPLSPATTPRQSRGLHGQFHCRTLDCPNRPFGNNSLFCINCIRKSSTKTAQAGRCRTLGCSGVAMKSSAGYCLVCTLTNALSKMNSSNPDPLTPAANQSERRPLQLLCNVPGCHTSVVDDTPYCSVHGETTKPVAPGGLPEDQSGNNLSGINELTELTEDQLLTSNGKISDSTAWSEGQSSKTRSGITEPVDLLEGQDGSIISNPRLSPKVHSVKTQSEVTGLTGWQEEEDGKIRGGISHSVKRSVHHSRDTSEIAEPVGQLKGHAEKFESVITVDDLVNKTPHSKDGSFSADIAKHETYKDVKFSEDQGVTDTGTLMHSMGHQPLVNDDQVLSVNVMEPDGAQKHNQLLTSSDVDVLNERVATNIPSPVKSPCIGPMCHKLGEKHHNGLCTSCHEILLRANSSVVSDVQLSSVDGTSIKRTNQSCQTAMRCRNPSKPIMLQVVADVKDAADETHNDDYDKLTVGSYSLPRCIMDGCNQAADDPEFGLCYDCFEAQIWQNSGL